MTEAGRVDAQLADLQAHFEARGAGERAWGVHYARMVLRGQLPVAHAPTLPDGVWRDGMLVGNRPAKPGTATHSLHCDECGELSCEHRP